ncbi:Rieske (2Fe-2S) protein [Curvibacter sp. CHRR-16]|uniref:Rieske (2Fe-2S) protein n=1 Tax=Curvibacter sp. CHRR-16 TaxID=2835872 RepID=UPI001BDAADF9|nr:Rieske (2Fe-2S) protein [Curvibacter sp. CHRR-16]MBT0571378.1 Rieske (2Fe-2S) protein [Curvibacter sp. CHRR-16]
MQDAPFQSQSIALCPSSALLNSGLAVPFDVQYGGQTCLGFAVRYADKVYAYLNRCSHVPMEMDYQPNRFFDMTGHWIMCATHGAQYDPRTGRCRSGPCRGALVPIATTEVGDMVYWHTAYNLKPIPF